MPFGKELIYYVENTLGTPKASSSATFQCRCRQINPSTSLFSSSELVSGLNRNDWISPIAVVMFGWGV